MAFADFDIDGGGTNAFTGGVQGVQYLHSALSNPLLLQGNDCRRYHVPGTPWGGAGRQLLYNPNLATYPNFNSILDTVSISVRMWVRIGYTPNLSTGALSAAVVVKGGTAKGANATYPGGSCKGYVFGLGLGNCFNNYRAYTSPPPSGLLDLQLGLNGADPISTNTGGNAGFSLNDLHPVNPDTWIQIRLDVIPTSNNLIVDRDTVRGYYNSGTEAAPIWTLVAETVVLNSDGPNIWSAWGDALHSRVGFFVCSTGGDFGNVLPSPVYIDGFDARLVVV